MKHTLKGNVLWSVNEGTSIQDDNVMDRWIGCTLLAPKRDYGWGYKELDESAGPYYYTCPNSFLDMVPENNAAWRKTVRAYNRKLRIGETIALLPNSLRIGAATIASVRPLKINHDGKQYHISRLLIALECEEQS